MTFTSTKLHPDIRVYLLKKQWLPYWINARVDLILSGSEQKPLNFEEWWQQLEQLVLPFNMDN